MSNVPPAWRPPGAPPPPPPPQGPPLSVPPAPPPPGFGYPPGYAPAGYGVPPGYAPGPPPRPDTKVAAWLMIAGAIVIAVGCFLPWLEFGGESVNGFDDLTGPLDDEPATGAVFMFFAVVLLAFGITTIAAKRLLPIMIIGIVVAAFSTLGAIAEYSDYDDSFIGEPAVGIPVVILGSGVALAGAIAGCSKRRRWR